MPQDFSIKYGGRGFQFMVIVNTDEDMETVIGRLTTAAGGAALNAVVVAAGALTREELESVFQTARSAADSGSGKPFQRS